MSATAQSSRCSGGKTSPRLRARSVLGASLAAGYLALAGYGNCRAELLADANAALEKLPFVPIPEVATDPNSGTTAGFLPVVMFPDASGDVRHILAPDVTYNDVLGAGGEFRLFNYPSADSKWYVVAGGAQTIYREVDLEYATGLSRQSLLSFEGRFYFARDPSRRFFGIGNHASHDDQSNYTLEQVRGEALLGFNLTPKIQLALAGRPRRIRIRRGAFTDVPFTGDRFPALEGLEGGTDALTRFIASYDVRDSIQLPTTGGLVAVFVGGADRRLGSSVSYATFGADARHYLPLASRLTLATHAHLHYVTGAGRLPFWTLGELGGQTTDESSAFGLPLGSGATWRGGGAGRFVDRNVLALNVELRIRLFEIAIAGARVTIEPAPFVDLGRVFGRLGENPLRVDDLHPAGGIGFRALVAPFVVGYVDVGYGPNGAEFFSGINYPF